MPAVVESHVSNRRGTGKDRRMPRDYDWAMGATLLEDLPPEPDGSPRYRELVSDTLRRCFDYAAMMTVEGRRKLHIETADGGRIEAAELAESFGDGTAEHVTLGPARLA
jgi:hypothetical protein